MLFKPSNMNSNFGLTLGYLNPALNNSAQFGIFNRVLNIPNWRIIECFYLLLYLHGS